MSKSKFHFDQYINEIITEALNFNQMQDQLRSIGLDPSVYDQKHLLFLVALINSNQGIEIYDELLQKITDKGLLNSLLSVCINDRRSNKPTIDLDKIHKALENPNDIRNIISNQKRETPIQNNLSEYDANKLKEFLNLNNSIDLFDILLKLRPELNDTLKIFLSEYNVEAIEVKEYLKTNTQRAKTINDLIAILHEGHTKFLNPFNYKTTLTVKDLKEGADFYNDDIHFYIIRTTFPDDIPKTIKYNLKYGQGNRFGLCISSKTNNYTVDYRIGEMHDDYPVTTYFIYKYYDTIFTDPNDINNYEIAIIDASTNIDINNMNTFSYNKVAKVISFDEKTHKLNFEFSNRDVGENDRNSILHELDYLIKDQTVKSKDGRSYTINNNNFYKIFSDLKLSEKEEKIKILYHNFSDELFLSFDQKDQYVLIKSRKILDKISKEVLENFPDDIIIEYLNDEPYDILKRKNHLNLKNGKFKKIIEDKFLKYIREKVEIRTGGGSVYDTNFKTFDYPNLSEEEYNLLIKDPELSIVFSDFVKKNNDNIRKVILQYVNKNNVYKGNLYLKEIQMDYRIQEEVYHPSYFLPDLSDIIIDGELDLTGLDLFSLKGCPKIVTGLFLCPGNIKSLEGGPLYARNYSVRSKNLETLKGLPEYLETLEIIYCSKLKNLEYCPKIVKEFWCKFNSSLVSMKGCTKIIIDNFEITNNKLKSFKDGPELVGGDYIIKDNHYYAEEVNITTRANNIRLLDYKHIDSKVYEMGEKLKLTEEDLITLQQAESFLENKLNEMLNQAMTKNEIKKESVVYNLMKSFLLTS
jgi:hypothetical protein